MRELAARKRATESSQEKELRLRARRVDEQRLSATARTGRKQSRLAEETKHERRPTIADGTSERLSLKDTAANICTTADGQILKVGPGGYGSLPSLRGKPAPLSLCHLQRNMAAVCFPTADIFLLQMQARQKAVSIIFC